MRQKFGVDEELEEEANRLLNLEAITSQHEKSDVLTVWKEMSRHRREVYTGRVNPSDLRTAGVQEGSPERHMRLGMFHRVANRGRPDLNSRDGLAGMNRHRQKGIPWWDAGMTVLPPDCRGMTMTLEAWQRGEHVTQS